MNFTDFTLNGGLQEGLTEAGYITCMPVQEQVLKNGLDGSDLYVQSQTGTGKTAAYLITILQRLITDPTLAGKKALIMVPTRELAVQVEEEAKILGSSMKLKSASFYGGVGYTGQQELLKRGVDIIIGTPGRVIDLQESKTMDLSQVAFLVIDEADRMFDMGFYPDLRTLIKVLPKVGTRQTMLFSATLNATVKNLAWEYTVAAKEITIEAENVTVDEIDQLLFHVSSNEKMKLLLGLIQKEKPDSLIVFCNTKRMSEIVARRLQINGYEADFIIGDLPQSKRLQVIDSFKSGSLKMLVATDVAARGIDVDSLSMVINYDLPNEAENYVHRTGRTARAGKTGKAYSFCSEQDVYNLPAIQKYCESKIPSCVPGEEDLVEDKSANTYIRTNRYDSDYADSDDSRGRGGRDSRSGPGRPSGNRKPDGRERKRSEGRPSPQGRKEEREPRREESKPYEGRNRPGNTQASNTRPANTRPSSTMARNENRTRENHNEPDLSKLDFDQRMAYYKNKYGSDDSPRAGGNQQKRTSGGQNKNRSRQNPNSANQNPQRQSGQQNKKPASNVVSNKQNSKNQVAAKTAAQKPVSKKQNSAKTISSNKPNSQTTVKKSGIGGFFSKLFSKK
ncbi:MAG TPA: DEAD/DEAH box helicase [Treponemataceae bacterium]|nr:DEAD/DEAH box helicase [Treponemataceae bacterium]